MTKLVVCKSNKLINASYNLNKNELRVILFAISKLNPKNPENRTVEIKANEFLEHFSDLNKNNVYDSIKLGLNELYNKSVVLKDKNIKVEFRWLQENTYYTNLGYAKITFSEKIMPYLFELEKNYTKYNLVFMSLFKSMYSIRIYELLVQYKDLKKRYFDYEELRNILLMGNKYKRFFDFKKNVLDVAITEINKTSNINVTYTTNYNLNKTVKSINFNFVLKNEYKPKTQKKANNVPYISSFL